MVAGNTRELYRATGGSGIYHMFMSSSHVCFGSWHLWQSLASPFLDSQVKNREAVLYLVL